MPKFTACLVLYLCSFFLTFSGQNSFVFSGTVSDSTGKALPFATISVNQAQYGALSDSRGTFRLVLPAGTHQVRISFLGYKPIEEALELKGPVIRSYQMRPEALNLEEVLITSDGRDPAYGIIRLAIDRKKQNAKPFDTYAYDAYTKTAIDFRKGFDPDSLLKLMLVFGGNRGQTEQEVPAELKKGLLFLSENYSRVHIRQPDKIKEEKSSSPK